MYIENHLFVYMTPSDKHYSKTETTFVQIQMCYQTGSFYTQNGTKSCCRMSTIKL